MARNGSSSKTKLLPRNQDVSGVAADDPSDLHQSLELVLTMPYLNPLECKLWATRFVGHALPKGSQQKGEIPWGQCVWQQQIGQNILSLRRGIGRTF